MVKKKVSFGNRSCYQVMVKDANAMHTVSHGYINTQHNTLTAPQRVANEIV